jgi:hypothetical protein
MAEKPKTETEMVRGNPVIPPPPIPSQVRMSMVPKPPEPVAKMVEGKPVEATSPIEEEKGEVEKAVEEEEVDVRPKGTVTIKVFENSPYEVDFTGMITGSEIDIAWKAMMREYKQWKHRLMKEQEEAKSGGM